MLICLFASGCGYSSKDQIIMADDYSDGTEKEYDATGFKRIEVFQTDGKASAGQQKTDGNRLILLEIYQYNDEFYCKASFDFSEQEYTAKLSADISARQHRWKGWKRAGHKTGIPVFEVHNGKAVFYEIGFRECHKDI